MRWPDDTESLDFVGNIFSRYRKYGGIWYSVIVGFIDAVKSGCAKMVSVVKDHILGAERTYVSQL